MYVGIISDTHGVFSDEFKKFLEPVDVIWHAGDFGGGVSFARQISAFKPLIGVYGNCDGQDIRYEHPRTQLFNCEGLKVLMTHIGGSPGHYPLNVEAMLAAHAPDIFVCGHSHILMVKNDPEHKLLYINPGAAGIQGWQVVRTALRVRIDGKNIHDMEVFNLKR
jgi:putative phosphoesterase